MVNVRSVEYPDELTELRGGMTPHWAEATIHPVVDSIEDYARARPLAFGLWALSIGFALGWKLKPW